MCCWRGGDDNKKYNPGGLSIGQEVWGGLSIGQEVWGGLSIGQEVWEALNSKP